MTCHLLAVVVLSALASSTVVTASVAQDRADEAALGAFHNAIADYIRLQRRLKAEVPSLVITSQPQAITDASATLAAAIQRARRGAKRGDIFDKAAASVIGARIRTALRGVDLASFVNAISDESTFRGQPRVHLRFPEGLPMATMPAALLEILPSLPAELEYRLLGRHLILRDRDAALVLDYVVDAIPPK